METLAFALAMLLYVLGMLPMWMLVSSEFRHWMPYEHAVAVLGWPLFTGILAGMVAWQAVCLVRERLTARWRR